MSEAVERSSVEARPRGRPRSERARRAILRAAGELLERDGFSAVTVEAIAARAGVSKATVYRWWPNKAAVATDSFLELIAPEIHFASTGCVREDLLLQMRALAQVFAGKNGRIIVSLVAAGHSDPEIAKTFRARWTAKRRDEVRSVLSRGVESGELRIGLDLDAAMDALYGPIYYRLLVGHAPLDEAFVNTLVDHVINGLRAD
jgi:AcrR family transcriptional regulator